MALPSNDQDVSDEDTSLDRGWAWMIAFAGFIAMFLGVGVYRTLGILMVELMVVYEASISEVSLILTCAGIGLCVTALLLMFGLGDIVHERALLVLAAILITTGLLVTYFSRRVADVYVLGFCIGASMQITFACSLSLVGKYFKARLAIGSGIVVAGVSVGTLVLPPFIRWLYDELTYRGAALIMIGICLNTLVAGALMRPKYKNNIKREKGKKNSNPGIIQVKDLEMARAFKASELCHEEQKGNIYVNEAFVRTEAELAETAQIQKTGNDKHIGLHNGANGSGKSCLSSIKIFVIRPSWRDEKSESVWKTIVLTLKFFKNPSFVLFQLFWYLTSVAIECVVQFYPALTKELGMTPYQSAFLLSIIGGASFFGRLCYGFLGDCLKTRRHKLVIVPQYILGCACFLSRFATEFWSQAIFAVVIGFNYGIAYSFLAVILVDLFDKSTLLRRMGVTNFVLGVAYSTAGPFIAFIRDTSGDYSLPLEITGAMFFASGTCLLAIGLIRCYQQE